MNRRPSKKTSPPISPPPSDTRWRPATLALAASLVYLNGITTPFLFDDVPAVLSNDSIRQLSNFSGVLFPGPNRPVSGRPLANLSLAMNYAIGGLNVVGYHAFNIAVHVLCALLLFAIVRRTLELPGIAPSLRQGAANIAFAAALLWAIHPLNTDVVDYITQRTESMMAFFYLLTIYASLRATRRWQWIAVFSCLLGVACKESMVTAPVVVVLFDRIFLFDSFRDAWRSRWRLYVGLFATWIPLAALLVLGPRTRVAAILEGVSPWTYLLNQAPMLVRYLWLVVWPKSLVLLYGWPLALTLGDVFPSAAFITALLVLSALALWRWPRAGFLAACFWMVLAPTSSIVPMITEVGAERRMYLPLAAVVVLLVIGAVRLGDALGRTIPALGERSMRARVAALLLIAISVPLAAATIVRNQDYSSPRVMAQTIVDRYPTPLAHQALGTAFVEEGRPQDAIAQFRQALLPGAPRARYLLGVELMKSGHVEEGIAALQASLQDQPPYSGDVVDAHGRLGTEFAKEERWPEAIREFQAVLQNVPGDPATAHMLADALFSQGQLDEAIVHYREYLASGAGDAGALNNLGVALASTGKLDDAVVTFRRAAEVDPANGAAERNLANGLTAQGNLPEALVHARRAVTLQPDDAGSQDVLGRILAGQGQIEAARSQFERALQLDPSFADAQQDLQALRGRGDRPVK